MSMDKRPNRDVRFDIAAEPDHPENWPPHPKKKMIMSPLMLTLGAMAAFSTVVFMVVILPTTTFDPAPSDNFRELTELEEEGRDIYLANGCVYCHSGFSRPQDVYTGLYYVYPRVSEPGDYVGDGPNLFGTQRTGPDLSNAGGYHPDDWHYAHYYNPRYTTPTSIMPQFKFLSVDQAQALIAFTQSQGGKAADTRNQHQIDMKAMLEANGAERVREPSNFPPPAEVTRLALIDRGYWFEDNPLELTQEDLIRGRQIFEENCIACHGSEGDGQGPGAPFLNPQPPGFTNSDFEQTGMGASPGAYYWRILRGVPGTAMENFGTRLSVEDIWRTVLFLKTIPNGGLTADVPTVDMYVQWEGMPEQFEWAACFLTEEEAFTFATPGIATPDPTQAAETATATAEGTPGILTPTPPPSGEPTPTTVPGDSPPVGVGGDVPGIVALGQVNPVYAVSLWMMETNAVPCATEGYETVTWNDIVNWADGGPDGFARQGTPQMQFIPSNLLNEDDLPPKSLESVWE